MTNIDIIHDLIIETKISISPFMIIDTSKLKRISKNSLSYSFSYIQDTKNKTSENQQFTTNLFDITRKANTKQAKY